MSNPRRATASCTAILLFAVFALESATTPAAASFEVRSRWVRTAIGFKLGYRGFSALDVDGDGSAEVFAAPYHGNVWQEWKRAGSFRQTWSSFPDPSTLIDLEASATPEGPVVVLLFESSLRLVDASSKVVIADFPTTSLENQAFAVGDLDGNGILDAVVCDGSDLFVFELLTGSQTAIKTGFGCTQLALGRTDADSQMEIAIAGNPAGGYVLDGVSLLVEWGDVTGFGSQVMLGDVDGDGFDELLASSDSSPRLRAIEPTTGDELWQPDVVWNGQAEAVAELDPSPGLEVVVHQPHWSIAVISGLTGALIRDFPSANFDFGGLRAVETDGDGDLDLVWAGTAAYSTAAILVVDGGESEIEVLTDGYGELTGRFSVGDFAGQGGSSVAFGAASFSSSGFGRPQVVLLDMVTGLEERRTEFDPLFDVESITCVVGAQLDADEAEEICVSFDAFDGPIRCLDGDTFETQWTASSSAAVSALAVGDLDGGGFPEIVAGTTSRKISAREGESGWLKWESPGDGVQWYDFNQIEIMDFQGDATPEVVARGEISGSGVGDLLSFSGADGLPVAGPWDAGIVALATDAGNSVSANQLFVGLADRTLRTIDPATGVASAATTTLPADLRALAVVDLNRDGVLDWIALGEDGYTYLTDGATPGTPWAGAYLGQIGPYLSVQVSAGDMDRNGVPDFLVATPRGLFYFEGPLQTLLLAGFETGDTSEWTLHFP